MPLKWICTGVPIKQWENNILSHHAIQCCEMVFNVILLFLVFIFCNRLCNSAKNNVELVILALRCDLFIFLCQARLCITILYRNPMDLKKNRMSSHYSHCLRVREDVDHRDVSAANKRTKKGWALSELTVIPDTDGRT